MLDPWAPQLCRVARVIPETRDTFTLELRVADGEFAFQPGQFNMLYVFGVGEVPISVSGDPARTTTVAHTTRAVGTVTRAMGALRRNATLGVRGPYGQPWPLAQAAGRHVVLVAGGIGLAPLRPVLHEIVARRKDFGDVVLLYGTRGPEDILFRRELQRWQASERVRIETTVDRAIGPWPGHVGVVTALIPRLSVDPENTVAFICGPEVMMRFAATALQNRGLPLEHIFVSLERNMKCAVGFCGRCQLGPSFVCKDGPVFPYERVMRLLALREV